jgi:hypothetical protein
MNIELPISLGEAFDKLTILDIKYNKILDDRKNVVKIEYDLLADKLNEYITKYIDLYNSMKKVNILLWDMMDILRDGTISDELYVKICKKTIIYNDIRFRIKNKINYMSKSFLKEQKGYKINRFIINLKKNSDTNKITNIIKYFSFIYDEIIIESTDDLSYLIEQFNYDETIFFKNNCENIEYIKKISIEDKNYSQEELYKLFGVTYNEINSILF